MRLFIHKFRYLLVGLALVIVVGLAVFFGLRKTVTLSIDGQARQLTTRALRVADLLQAQGVALSPDDNLSPALTSWLKDGQVITLTHAIPVQILADGKISSIYSAERLPAALLSQAGLSLSKGDQLLSNGLKVDPAQPIPLKSPSLSLQLVRSVAFSLLDDGQQISLSSTAPSLGSALWAAGYSLYTADLLEPPSATPLASGLAVTLTLSAPVTIRTQSGEVKIRSAARTVSGALEDAQLSPQGLDYSLPTSQEPIPLGGPIRLIRVTEQVLVEQTPIPFETEFQADSELDLDSQSVIQAGEPGMQAERVRIRYEDGTQASRQVDSQWIARQPQSRIIGYGTNIVMHTTSVDGVSIQYWRSLSMYATSYHPSEVGDTTASGLPLKKGVCAVDTSLVPFFTELYIPGYGKCTAADIGGGVIGRWIDLGYSDNDYVPWHSTVTVYFLWPAPANIVWIVP